MLTLPSPCPLPQLVTCKEPASPKAMRWGRFSDVVIVCVATGGRPPKFGVLAKNSTAYWGGGFWGGGTCGGFVHTSAKLTVPSSSLWVAIPVMNPEFRFDL